MTCDDLDEGRGLRGEKASQTLADEKWRHRAVAREERNPKWSNATLAETRLQIPFAFNNER